MINLTLDEMAERIGKDTSALATFLDELENKLGSSKNIKNLTNGYTSFAIKDIEKFNNMLPKPFTHLSLADNLLTIFYISYLRTKDSSIDTIINELPPYYPF